MAHNSFRNHLNSQPYGDYDINLKTTNFLGMDFLQQYGKGIEFDQGYSKITLLAKTELIV